MRQGGGQDTQRGGPGNIAAGLGSLLSMIDSRRGQWNKPPPQNPQPIPFPTPFSWSAQRSAPPQHLPGGPLRSAPSNPPHRSTNNNAPAVKPPPVPQPPAFPSVPPQTTSPSELVSSEERSKMSVQEYEDYLLSVALSLSTKEEEDKKGFIVVDETPSRPEQPNPADTFQVKKEPTLDHKDLEGWLHFQEVSTSTGESKQPMDQSGSVPSMKLYDIPLPPLPSQLDSAPPQAPEAKPHEEPKEPCLLQTNLQDPSAPIFSVTQELQFDHGTATVSVVKQTYPSLEDLVTTNSTAMVTESVPADCGDSSEDQIEGDDSPSPTSSPRGRKRKNESIEPREKRRKAKKKMIKLQQELKEKEERIKGLEDQIEESDKKFGEQNERLSRLERTLADYEKNNAELGSTWCSIM